MPPKNQTNSLQYSTNADFQGLLKSYEKQKTQQLIKQHCITLINKIH